MAGKYFRLLRVHHYVKNILVMAASGCSGTMFEDGKFLHALLGFAVFCMISSAVYIINDIRDIERDKIHPVKCKRPLASGEVSVKTAVIIASALIMIAVMISVCMFGIKSSLLPVIYIAVNIAYSTGLKNIPVLDIAVLVSGFIMRLLYGALITDIEISHWLYLSVMAMAFYLALGKRRNELRMSINTREVLNFYSESFLDKNMYVCLALANVFYALWSVDEKTMLRYNSRYLIFTVPVILLICMKYSLDVERNSSGDPAEVLFSDKILMVLCVIYLVGMFSILYL